MMKDHHEGNYDLMFIPLFFNEIWMGLGGDAKGRSMDIFCP